jgi:hypothetical protein
MISLIAIDEPGNNDGGILRGARGEVKLAYYARSLSGLTLDLYRDEPRQISLKERGESKPGRVR